MSEKVGIYARQSVDEEQGISQQLAESEAECDRRKWLVTRRYQDNDTSATKERGESTEWARMLTDIRGKAINVVMVTETSRLARRLEDAVDLFKLGVRIVVVRGSFDSADPYHAQAIKAQVLRSEDEIVFKKQRTMPYAAARRAAGHPTPGLVPYGYRWVPEHERRARGSEQRYAIVPEEAEIVRWMFAEALAIMATDSEPLAAICRELNRRGIATRGSKKRPAAPWRNSTVRRMLLNPFYAARLPEKQPTGTYRAERVNLDTCADGNWEPIVSVEELRAVRRFLINPLRRTHDGNTGRKWVLSGLARCSICLEPVRACKSKEGHHAYKCRNMHFQRRGDALDSYVIETVLARLSMPDAASLIETKAGVDIAALTTRERAIQAELDAKFSMVGTGPHWTPERVAALCVPLDAELDRVRAELAAASAGDPLAGIAGADDVRRIWEGLSLARKRAVIGAVCTPYLDRVGKGRVVKTREDAAATVRIAWRGTASEHSRVAWHETEPLAWPELLPPADAEALAPLLNP